MGHVSGDVRFLRMPPINVTALVQYVLSVPFIVQLIYIITMLYMFSWNTFYSVLDISMASVSLRPDIIQIYMATSQQHYPFLIPLRIAMKFGSVACLAASPEVGARDGNVLT